MSISNEEKFKNILTNTMLDNMKKLYHFKIAAPNIFTIL